MNLIRIEKDGSAVLDPQIISVLAEYEKTMKLLEEKQKEIRDAILEEMRRNNLVKIDMDKIKITYVAPTTKEKFNSKAFRNEYPDVYDEFVEIAPVKDSIRITLK